MPTDDDRKTKKIKVEITHQEVNVGEVNSVFVYNICLRSAVGVWEEPATSKEHMEAIIRGINMALGMIGVPSGIPSGIHVPLSMEITCFKGHVCRGFESPPEEKNSLEQSKKTTMVLIRGVPNGKICPEGMDYCWQCGHVDLPEEFLKKNQCPNPLCPHPKLWND